MRQVFFTLSMLLLTACRSAYLIDLKEVSINKSPEGGFGGHLLIDKKSASTMKKYGEVYIYAKTCEDEACPVFGVGTIDRHKGIELGNSTQFEMNLHNLDLSIRDEENWMSPFICFKLIAYQGYVGREGQSGWNCPKSLKN